MLSKDDTPPTSKDEAHARRMRPPPGKYDPDSRSHWSITMTVAWIIWRDIDAVRNEWDDYRNECADWRFEGNASARAKVADIAMKHISTGKLTRLPGKFARLPKKLRKGFQKGSLHFRQWGPSRWNRLRLGALSENLPPQVAIDELWLAAGEDRIKATALECKNAKAFIGDRIKIPPDLWQHLKRTRRSVVRKGGVVRRPGPSLPRGSVFPIGRQRTLAKASLFAERRAFGFRRKGQGREAARLRLGN